MCGCWSRSDGSASLVVFLALAPQGRAVDASRHQAVQGLDKCDQAERGLALRAGTLSSELDMEPDPNELRGPTIFVVGGVHHILTVDRNPHFTEDPRRVERFADLLKAVVELSVAYEKAEAPGR